MSEKDAYMFPIYGSAVLLSIYLLFKFVPKEILSVVFLVHFSILGLLVCVQLFKPAINAIVPAHYS
jgi:minor histocompatibility antigen H13